MTLFLLLLKHITKGLAQVLHLPKLLITPMKVGTKTPLSRALNNVAIQLSLRKMSSSPALILSCLEIVLPNQKAKAKGMLELAQTC